MSTYYHQNIQMVCQVDIAVMRIGILAVKGLDIVITIQGVYERHITLMTMDLETIDRIDIIDTLTLTDLIEGEVKEDFILDLVSSY